MSLNSIMYLKKICNKSTYNFLQTYALIFCPFGLFSHFRASLLWKLSSLFNRQTIHNISPTYLGFLKKGDMINRDRGDNLLFATRVPKVLFYRSDHFWVASLRMYINLSATVLSLKIPDISGEKEELKRLVGNKTEMISPQQCARNGANVFCVNNK